MSDREDRPTKRLRVEQADSQEGQLQDQVSQPATYLLRAPHAYPQQAPTFSQPTHISSFSFDGQRTLLTKSSGKNDAGLRFFTPPPLPCDLNTNFSQATFRDDSLVEGLDALLVCLLELPQTSQTTELLTKTKLITWRGMLTRLVTALYENRDGWEMQAQVVNGTLYLQDYMSETAQTKKRENSSDYKLQTYYGYSFESFCTSEHKPSGNIAASSNPSSMPMLSVNTNEQWCSVVKLNLGGFRIIVGGEVDCVIAEANTEAIKPSDFVELKTNLVINSSQDEFKFEKFKMLKFYMQSFLIGCPKIVVGFRTRQGILQTVQHFKTMDLPRLVRNKPHAWNPSLALKGGYDLANFLHATVANAASTRDFESRFHSGQSEDLTEWPVFHVTFKAGGREFPGKIEISEQIDRTPDKSRIGFLPQRWIESLQSRHAAAGNASG